MGAGPSAEGNLAPCRTRLRRGGAQQPLLGSEARRGTGQRRLPAGLCLPPAGRADAAFALSQPATGR